MLDLRTQEGRYARDICDGITADLGGAPNAAEQILCQMFALKVLRVQLLVKTILSGEAVNRHTENYCLAWMNGRRRAATPATSATALPLTLGARPMPRSRSCARCSRRCGTGGRRWQPDSCLFIIVR